MTDHRATDDAARPNGHPGTARDALERIWDIVTTPTKATNHRSAERHFMADFDAIRTIIKPFLMKRASSGLRGDRTAVDEQPEVR